MFGKSIAIDDRRCKWHDQLRWQVTRESKSRLVLRSDASLQSIISLIIDGSNKKKLRKRFRIAELRWLTDNHRLRLQAYLHPESYFQITLEICMQCIIGTE